ncbi:MAG: hypothetical protein IJ583_13830 [Firmicutes bacterium]|nr:hypothetical protein [Bacillota bacterium]
MAGYAFPTGTPIRTKTELKNKFNITKHRKDLKEFLEKNEIVTYRDEITGEYIMEARSKNDEEN